MNISAQVAGKAYCRHYRRVSKQAGTFRVHSTFHTYVVEDYWDWNQSFILMLLRIIGIGTSQLGDYDRQVKVVWTCKMALSVSSDV